MIGGKGEQKTLRLVARHADIWHSFVRPDELPHKLDVIERWAEREQRDTSNLVISNELHQRGEGLADELYDAGVRLFTLALPGPRLGLRPHPVVAALARLEERLTPALPPAALTVPVHLR